MDNLNTPILIANPDLNDPNTNPNSNEGLIRTKVNITLIISILVHNPN